METLPPETLAELEAMEAALQPRSNRYLDAYRRKEPRFPSPTQRAGLLLNDREHVLFGGAAGGGKALALNTPLPTPTGWTTMGEVRARDWLLDENGQPCRVVGATGVMHGHRVYDVEFSDGSVIRADGGHQWLVTSLASSGPEILTTEQIQASLVVAHIVPSEKYGDRLILSVREVPSEPVKCVQVDSPSHLYLAGRTFIPTHNSSWLLGSALEYVDVPGYSAILFRRKYTDLGQPGALIPRSHEWLKGTDAHWRGDSKEWAFPSGAVLKFGYMDGANDHENYQGAEFQYVGFDESGQMEPHQMTYMQTRTRRLLGSEVPIRFRYTANPGGRAHDWLVENFMLKMDPNWVFVPSLARDNPGLDVVDYVRRLDAISDPVLRAQMRDGDWGAVDRSGLVCPEWTPEVEAACLNPDYGPPAYFTVYVGADPGSTDLFVLLWAFFDFVNARLVVVDERWFRNPRTEEVGDAAVEVERQHFAEAKAAGRIDAFQRFTDIDHRFVADLKAKPWHLNFAPTQKTDHDLWERQLRTAIRQGRITIHPRCELLLRTLRHARRKENGDYERTKGTGHADAWAALLYLFRNVNWQRNPFPVVEAPSHPLAPPKPVARTFAQRAASGALPSFKPLG